MALVFRIGLAHHQHDFTARVNGISGPPLAAIQDVFVAVAFDFQFHISGIGRRHLRFCHGVCAANLARKKRLKPLLLLRQCAVLGQHFHIAPIGRVAIKHGLSPNHLAHGFKQRCDFHVSQTRTPWLIFVWQK